MAETEKLDALGLIQEQMYADIADFIVRDSVIRAIGEDNPDVSRNFWLTLVDNPEGIAKIFYEHLERLGRTAEFEHASNLLTLFGGTDVIDFKRIYAFREDDFGCTDSSEASLERAKKLLIPLIEEEIPTQKLICMLCYCETHKKYGSTLFQKLYSSIFERDYAAMRSAKDEYTEEAKKKSVAYIKIATEKILMSAKQYYDKYYKYDAKILPICISIYYNTDDVERDLKSYMDEWYYQVPEGQMYIVDKGSDLDDHIKQAWDSLQKAQFKPLGRRTPDTIYRTWLKKVLQSLNSDVFFSIPSKEPIIPSIIKKQFHTSLGINKENKYNNFQDKSDAPSTYIMKLITNDTVLWSFGNLYLLILLTLVLLKNVDEKWSDDYQIFVRKSLMVPGVTEALSAYFCKRLYCNDNFLKSVYSEGSKKETNITDSVSIEELNDFIKWIEKYRT